MKKRVIISHSSIWRKKRGPGVFSFTVFSRRPRRRFLSARRPRKARPLCFSRGFLTFSPPSASARHPRAAGKRKLARLSRDVAAILRRAAFFRVLFFLSVVVEKTPRKNRRPYAERTTNRLEPGADRLFFLFSFSRRRDIHPSRRSASPSLPRRGGTKAAGRFSTTRRNTHTRRGQRL